MIQKNQEPGNNKNLIPKLMHTDHKMVSTYVSKAVTYVSSGIYPDCLPIPQDNFSLYQGFKKRMRTGAADS